jgi:cell division protein FtsW (lipid II flippase)
MNTIKRVLTQKPEPLLLLVPLILFGLSKLFTANTGVGVTPLENSNPEWEESVLFWVIVGFVAIPFLLHFLLRASRKWNPVVCRPQVYATVFLLLILFLLFYGNTSAMPAKELPDSGGWLKDAWNHNAVFTAVLVAGFILQVFFVGYFLLTIFKKSTRTLK